MIRPVQYYGRATVTPIAASRDAFTPRDRVVVTYGEYASKRFHGQSAYVDACRFAQDHS